MIKPTIGRVVLFNDGRSKQRVPALICYVHSDELINLGGFDSKGKPISHINIKLIQDDTPCGRNQAEWMPYQKNQAEKHDNTVEVAPPIPAAEFGSRSPRVDRVKNEDNSDPAVM